MEESETVASLSSRSASLESVFVKQVDSQVKDTQTEDNCPMRNTVSLSLFSRVETIQ